MAVGSIVASIVGSVISGAASVGVAALREHGAIKRQSMSLNHQEPLPFLAAVKRYRWLYVSFF